MDGKAIYGNTGARTVFVTYTSDGDSCLAGRPSTIKIVLTAN
jgi:hypothetical protein